MTTRVEVLDRVPAGDHSRRRTPPLLAAAGVVVAVAAALPALYLVVRTADGGASGVWTALVSATTARLLVRTMLLCLAVTAAACVIAVPLAWLTVRTDVPARRVFVVLTSLPLVIPSYVGAYAFVAAWGPRGFVQQALEPLGVTRLPSLYGFSGAFIVLTLFTYPLVLLTVRAAMRGLDHSLEEVARSLGRSSRRVFWTITLPQLRPAMATGALLVGLYVLSDFGAVSLLRFDSFTRAIYVSYRSSFDRTEAAVLGLVLVALMLVLLAAESRTRGRAAFHRIHGSAGRPAPTVRLGAWRWPAFAALGVLVLLALVGPLAMIALWLVRGILAGVALDVTVAAGLNSLRASLVAALVALVAAWPVAALAVRHPGRLARGVERASFTGYALPGIVVALALVFFGARFLPAAYQTQGMLVFAYVVLFLPLAIGAVRTSLLQVPPSLEDAARSLGSRPRDVLWRVVFPLVRPGAVTALALVFLTAMKELPATLLLAPIGFETLATRVWGATSAASFAGAAAPALALVLLSSAPLAVLVLREDR